MTARRSPRPCSLPADFRRRCASSPNERIRASSPSSRCTARTYLAQRRGNESQLASSRRALSNRSTHQCQCARVKRQSKNIAARRGEGLAVNLERSLRLPPATRSNLRPMLRIAGAPWAISSDNSSGCNPRPPTRIHSTANGVLPERRSTSLFSCARSMSSGEKEIAE